MFTELATSQKRLTEICLFNKPTQSQKPCLLSQLVASQSKPYSSISVYTTNQPTGNVPSCPTSPSYYTTDCLDMVSQHSSSWSNLPDTPYLGISFKSKLCPYQTFHIMGLWKSLHYFTALPYLGIMECFNTIQPNSPDPMFGNYISSLIPRLTSSFHTQEIAWV